MGVWYPAERHAAHQLMSPVSMLLFDAELDSIVYTIY